MIVWLIKNNDGNNIDGVFAQEKDALEHLRQLEKDFPGTSFYLESQPVIE